MLVAFPLPCLPALWQHGGCVLDVNYNCMAHPVLRYQSYGTFVRIRKKLMYFEYNGTPKVVPILGCFGSIRPIGMEIGGTNSNVFLGK